MYRRNDETKVRNVPFLLVPEGDDRVHFGGAEGGDPTGEQGNAAKDAIRLVWNEMSGQRLFPSDIEVEKIADGRFKAVRSMTARIEAEGAGYDLASHRASPPGIRIWAGATVERSDVEALLPWLDWAWDEERDAAKAA